MGLHKEGISMSTMPKNAILKKLRVSTLLSLIVVCMHINTFFFNA